MAEIIWNAGFERITFSSERYDTFSDAPSASSAAEFGTQGVNILAWKPTGERAGTGPARPVGQATVESAPHNSDAVPTVPDDVYDAGDLGCGDGPLLTIAQRLRALAPGAVLEVRSSDPGVAADLPSWCRMVGHTYLGGGSDTGAGRHFIRRKDG